MIIKTYPHKNLYGKYFLATEAPDDETITEDQPKPKRNVKVISVKPSNRNKDFTEFNDTEDQEIDQQNDTENAPDVQTPTDDAEQPAGNQDTAPTVEGNDTNNETQEDQPDTGDEDTTDFTDGAADTSEEDTGDETGEEPADSPDVDEDTTDFTDGADDMDTPTDDQNSENTETTDGKPEAPGVDLDSMRKYNLFKEYMSLYNACDNYISKLENILKNDYDANQIIRISVTNLREIRDILSDYMTIRFQLNSYVQSLLFYQKMVVSVQLVFNLLKSINSKEKS